MHLQGQRSARNVATYLRFQWFPRTSLPPKCAIIPGAQVFCTVPLNPTIEPDCSSLASLLILFPTSRILHLFEVQKVDLRFHSQLPFSKTTLSSRRLPDPKKSHTVKMAGSTWSADPQIAPPFVAKQYQAANHQTVNRLRGCR